MIVVLFYIAAFVAFASTIMALTRPNAAHGLIYLIISLLAVAVLFFLIGAPFAAALEIVIYAGAIMVLFIFVIMILNLSQTADQRERGLLAPSAWLFPAIFAATLLIEMLLVIFSVAEMTSGRAVSAKEVGITLFGPYLLAVEIAAMLLLAGLIGAYHLGHDYLRWQRGRGR